MELRVNDYVRTINGEIYKLIDDFALIYFQKEQEHGIPEHQIIKSSPNIIDLIEVEDYINGHRVTNISKEQGKNIEIYLDTNNLFEQTIYKNEDIKSIVTREMFKSIKYEVK